MLKDINNKKFFIPNKSLFFLKYHAQVSVSDFVIEIFSYECNFKFCSSFINISKYVILVVSKFLSFL